MEIKVKSASPDGMTAHIELFLDTWVELKGLIDVIAEIESGCLKVKRPFYYDPFSKEWIAKKE